MLFYYYFFNKKYDTIPAKGYEKKDMKKMYDLDLDLEHATKLSETTTELHKLYYDSKYSHFNLEQGIEHIKKNIITDCEKNSAKT